MVIAPDLKYVTVSIFPQGRFKIGLPSIKKYGILGFTKKTKKRSYSKEFKMELVEKCISGEASSIDLGLRSAVLTSEHPLSYSIAKNNKIEKYKSKWSA